MRIPKRWRFAGIALVGVLILFRIALPFVLAWTIPGLAADQNLYARVGNIDLGLIAGELTLEDVVVDFPRAADPQRASPSEWSTGESRALWTLDRLHVAFEWTDLLFKEIHLTALELDHPVVLISQRADGSLALPEPPTEDPSESPEEEEVEPPPDEEPSDWAFVLDRFELNTPEVTLRTQTDQLDVVQLAAEQLGFNSLFVGPDGIGLGGLDLIRPQVFVQREWMMDLGQGTPESQTPEPMPDTGIAETPPGEMPSLRVKHLKIERAGFTVRTAAGPVEVALRLDVTDAGNGRDQVFPVDLGLRIDDATVDISGQLGLNPARFEGSLKWENLSVPPFVQLIYPDLVPWLASCSARGELEIVFQSAPGDEPPGIRIQGEIHIADLSFRQPESGELALAWKSLDVEIREAFVPLEPTPELTTRVQLARVALDAPLVVYTNPPDALDAMLAAMGGDEDESPNQKATPEPQDEAAPDSGGAPQIGIDDVEVTQGQLRYVDRGVAPHHQTSIEKLRVRIEGVSTPPVVAAQKISVDGAIQSTGSFKLRGGLPGGEGKLDFSLRKLDLVTYDSLARGAGWQIQKGTTSLDTSIRATRKGYRTRNKLVLHDLGVTPQGGDGDSFASQFGVSVDLAIALLRDPAGNIPISAPISFDADGAGVDFAPVVISALRNALQGALASPIKMLGMLVPEGGADSLGAFPFPPGEAVPALDQHEQVSALAELVKDRPLLNISLIGHWSAVDRNPLALQILTEKAIQGGEYPALPGVGFFDRRRVAAALRDRAEGEDGELDAEDSAILNRYVWAQEVPEDRFLELARARARSLEAALRSLDAPADAITVGTVTSSSVPSVSIELGSKPQP